MKSCRHLLLLVFQMLVLSAVSAEAGLYSMNFKNAAHYRAKPGYNWIVSDDGRSIRHGSANWGMWTFGLGALPKIEEEYRLSFDVRLFEVNPSATDYHWGIDFKYGGGCHAHFHSRGKGFIFICRAASGKDLMSANGGEHATVADPKDPAWTRVTLDVRRDSFALRMNGDTCIQKDFGFLPLESFGFYSWGMDVEFRDIRVERLPALAGKIQAEPTFDLATATPTQVENAVWTNGINGAKALFLRAPGWGGARHAVTYDFQEPPIETAFGGVACWVRYRPGTPIVRFLGADGSWKGDLTIRGDLPIGFHCALEGGKHSLTFRRRVLTETLREDEWFHLAFTWDRDGSYKFFVNGLPFSTGETHGQNSDDLILGNILGETRRIELESKSPTQVLTVQDLRLYRRPLRNREVELAYRRGMPVDVVLGDDFMPAGRSARLKVDVAPGGVFTHCKPVVGERDIPATVDLTVTVEKIGPQPTRYMEQRAYTRCSETTFPRLKVTRAQTIETQPMTLDAGSYRVRVRVAGGYERYLFFSVADEVVRALPPPDARPWQKGERIWSRAFRSLAAIRENQGETVVVQDSEVGETYLEVGGCGSLNGDRYGCVVPFAREHLGQPCLISFTWPDDKARSFGLYMFKETPGRKDRFHRDRLQGGILAGGIYKTTGRLQTSEFLFYPSDTNHWLEVRTFIDGEPGALAKVEIHRLVTPWPRLKLRLPEGLPGRRFGHTDEDQTFDHNLNADFLKREPRAITATLLDYLDYTGQNAFHYALARYANTLGAQVGYDSNGMYPYRTAASAQAVRELTAGGVGFVGEVYFSQMAETRYAKLIEGDRSHWIMRDREGSAKNIMGIDNYPNFALTAVTDAYLNHYMDEVARLARNGMCALRHWMIGCRAFGAWDSPDSGYDDGNFAQFKADTHFYDRSLPDVAKTTDDFKRRYEVLNNAKNLEKWRRWRADKVTAFVARMVTRVHDVAPNLPVFLEYGSRHPDDLYVQNGIDLDALAKIPNVRFTLSHAPTSQHWNEFRRFAKKTGPKSRDWEAYFSLTNALAARIRKLQGAVPLCILHNIYFETFRDSLGGDRFGAYFESMDPKPWGRNFLRELTWAVACGDAQEIVIGDQPIGTLGSEAEAREFALAFRALPAIPFEDIGCGAANRKDVVARRAQTKNGTYYYLANVSGEETQADLPAPSLTDLSTGETVPGTRLVLRPYELRSFLQR